MLHPAFRQMKLANPLPTYFFKVYFNTVLSMTRLSKRCLHFSFVIRGSPKRTETPVTVKKNNKKHRVMFNVQKVIVSKNAVFWVVKHHRFQRQLSILEEDVTSTFRVIQHPLTDTNSE
jgi:hypothetical protein